MCFFWKLSGGDIPIIEKCDLQTRRRFRNIGIGVFIILLCVFAGFLFAGLYLFNIIQPTDQENRNMLPYSFSFSGSSFGIYCTCILIAFFLTFIFGNIYLLIITTYSKHFLAGDPPKNGLRVSNLIRLGFICFFAMVISKPIEVILLHNDPYLQNIVADKKREIANRLLVEYRDTAENSFIHQNQWQTLNTIFNSNYFALKLKTICSEKRFAKTWLGSVALVFVFLLPVYFKRRLSIKSDYYTNLREIQIDFVKQEYLLFKEEYKTIFKRRLDIDVEFYETWENPPFNTVRKGDGRTFKKQQDFLKIFQADARS